MTLLRDTLASSTRRRLLAALALAGACQPALAAFPDRPITVVIPYPPGGAADVGGRIIARHLAQHLAGSTVVVENKPGAGTALAAAAVAQAKPDGYTLFYSGNTTYTMNPALRTKVGYDPIRSYEAIGMIGTVALALIAHPSAPAKTLPELIALARSQPAKVVMASFGAGTSSHFVGELFKNQAGISMVHVPYKGSAPMMQDLVGGQIPFAVDTSLAAAPQEKGGRIKVLAVSSPKRVANLPDTPTFAELGFPGFDLTAWSALVAPRGLPADVRNALIKALATAMATPAMREDLRKVGVDVLDEPPSAYEARVNRELPAMRALVIRANMSVD
ncbi:MAG: tripartite tricarboxylate transporter substrate binding protein [Burkholderiaceae bacterium]|nr:tripartite tricarboxylate transporter substrate binding protein [Burkholderiaceae bacterium]